MAQSDDRTPRRGGGVPPSFGRSAEDAPAEEFKIVGGQAFMTLHVDVVPDPESLIGLYAQIKQVASKAIRDAYAETVGVALPEPPDRQAEGHGGAPAG